MPDSLSFDLDQLRIRAKQQSQNFDTFAKDIARGCGPLLGEASRLAFAASEILVQAAQVDAGRQALALLGGPAAPVRAEADGPPLSTRDLVMDALHARIPDRDGHRADLNLWNDRNAMAARILAALGLATT